MAPLDLQYFSELQKLSKFYEKNKLYNDFVNIYNLTSARVSENVLHLIDTICSSYHNFHRDIIEQWFTVIYAGMIAEENKAHAILKKRIKHLGMFQILIQNQKPYYAANFSKGKNWRELDTLMKEFGI